MFANGAGPPPPIVKILPEERNRCRARRVDQRRIGLQPDLASIRQEPLIELGIFVVRETFVVPPHPTERLKSKQGVMTVIDETPFSEMPVRRTARAQNRVLGSRCCDLEAGRAPRDHRDDDRVCAVTTGCIEQALHIPIRVGTMRIDTDKPLVIFGECHDGGIHPRALQLLGIVDQANPVMSFGEISNDHPASIFASPVGNNDQRIRVVVEQLRQE